MTIRDVKIYSGDGSSVYPASLSVSPAAGLEILANKVVKFLLTSYGTDLIDPAYGARAFSVTQISPQYLPKFRLELENDLERCRAFIKKSETEDTPRLSRLFLRDVRYKPDIDPTPVDLYIEILTVTQEHALLHVHRNI